LPDATRYFKRDFFMLRLFARLLARRVPYLDLRQIVEELMRAVAEELDFSIEEDNLRHFAGLPMHERTRVPRTFPALCSSAVLVTEWVPGTILAEVIALDRSRAHDLLRVLMDSYVMQITRNGYYHVDPHPGNFMVDANNNLWLLDFGAVGQLSSQVTRNYRMLLARLLNLTNDDLGQLLANAGFHGGDPQAIASLSGFFIGARGRGRGTESDLAEIMQALRRHRIDIPDSFVLMMRVLITLGGFMQLHGVRFNLLNMIAPMQHDRRQTAADKMLT
jgi:ubiquinone biosynthesis protein